MDYTELLPPLPAPEHECSLAINRPAYTADQLRAYALSAIVAAAPAIRKAERARIQRLIKRRWKGGYPGEVVEDLVAAIRALPDPA